MVEREIDNLTMEQYLTLTGGNQAPGVVKPEIGGNVNFEIKSQFMRELREDTFSGNKNDDAHEHVKRVLDIEPSIPKISLKRPLSKGIVRHQEPPNSLRKFGTSSKKETRHYTKLANGIMTFYINAPLMISITIRRSIEGSSYEGITAIMNKLENLGRDMKKLKENVLAIHVGCQTRGGAYLVKDCPLKEEVKSIKEAKYGEFGRPSPFGNGAKYRVGPPGYYIRLDNRPPVGEKRPSLEELMNKHLEESTQRRTEMEEWLTNEFRTKAANEINSPSLDQCKSMYTSEKTPINNGQHEISIASNKCTQIVQTTDVSSKVLLYMTKRYPIGIVENVLVKIDKFLFPSDFVVIDMLNIRNETMILRRPFLATIHAEIDIFDREISLGIGGDRVTFDMDKKIHNFTTLIGEIYLINTTSNTPSDASSRVEETNDLHNENNYCNQKQGRSLSREYELGIGKKGHMQEDIWENYRKVQGDNTYWWHDQKSKEEKRQKLGINLEEYEPPMIHVETFKVKRKRKQSRFKDMICKEVDSGRRIHRQT
uniref:MAK10-like protein n=1 Tax=Tanacetum cinerariifolium TaxID=118510 RepID=A0A6L2K7R7_TANCI|nr:hypothetical protein [Tanacetum cinerariifolium]